MKVNHIKTYCGALSLIIIQFFLTGSLYAQYCNPINIGTFNTNYISNVSLGSIDNTSSGTTGGYMYYSNIAATDINAGETIEGIITVTINGWNTNTNTVAVWMNFNENEDEDHEDSGEVFLFTVKDRDNKRGNKTVSVPISIPIPNSVENGESIIRIGFRTGQNTNFTSCDYNYQAGEIEDYKINFKSATSNSTPNEFQPNYCNPSNMGSWNINKISKVVFGDINNSSSEPTGSYTYYSSLSDTGVDIGETINGEVEVILNGWNTGANTVAVWMNFNENGDDDFDDDGERFLFKVQDNNNVKGNKTINVPISIPVPNSVQPGYSIIRIAFRTGDDENFTSCDFNYQAGEIEDYKVSFSSSKSSLGMASSASSSIDTDGDGINDEIDLDDDNDGIPDSYECQNLLVDSGFDNKTGLNNGNNIDVDISPWILGGGDKSNIVKVDGAGGYNYGNGGPFEDANPLTGAGEDQYYLDIASGSNDFYQSFIVTNDAKLTYGGYFSSRDGRTGTARLRIFTGSSGSSGTLIADSSTFSVSPIGGDSSNTPWQLFEDVVHITAGTYSFVVSMDNDMNFDEGYTIACLDRDGDSTYDYIDIDSDDDGIPDNVEAQSTLGYIAPSNISSNITDTNNNGLDDVYESALGGTDLNQLEDTDGDGIEDYLDSDSDNDGTPDIEENGHADTGNNIDIDNDGLHDNLDSVTAHLDVNDEVTTGDVFDLTNSFEDIDSDATLGGDLDYRDLFDINPPTIASIDFDGIDDYLSTDSFIDGLSDITIMAWVKSDSGNATNMVIVGEDTGCKLWLENGSIPKFTIRTIGNSETTINCSAINFNEWHHITGTYTSSTGVMSLYIDGELLTSANVGSTGSAIENTENSNGNFEVGRLSTDNVSNRLYFKGAIDEVRVFDLVLTDDQIQQMVYQEIEDNSGNTRGTILVKDIEDTSTGNKVPWTNLIAYYPMTNIVVGRTSDYSSYDKELYINYITTIQDQTAPMPYVASNSGAWSSESTWLHGDVWDIENTNTNSDYGIVKISNNITANHDLKHIGLIIDSGQKLTIQGDHLVENSWYLELNGTLDLEDDSQLIQTEYSDLVTSADGKLLRRQEGTTSAYWYNYWASPVGATGATSLTDNNAATNNTNNSDFKLNLLKDDTGFNCSFTSAYTANGNISTYWLYTFINGVTYWDWEQLSTSTGIKPGVGYTQKGTGIPASEQQYIFEGKPNNGTILIDVTDVGGAGSVPSISETGYLLGNPYASALDIHKFIDDNAGVIDGVIQLWQQWSGTSHNLNEYNGGYAQVNKTGSIRAYQFVGFYGANNGSQDGTISPSRYLPVGQGFIAEIIADGTVEFNNTQRIFIKEADADGSYNNGSVFSKSAGTKSKTKKASAEKDINALKKIRLEFNSVSGPDTRRELLLGFSPVTTDAYDYGYDAENVDINNNDLHLSLEGKDMNIQAYSDITADKEVPLNFKSSGNNTFEIKITEMENIDETQAIYLKDNLTDTYFDLTENTAYQFTSNQGKFNERFQIVFQNQAKTLSVEESQATENFIYYLNGEHKLYAKKLNASVTRLALVNMLGQTALEFTDVPQEELRNGLSISNLSTGAYVAYFRTDNNQVLTKKIIVN